MSEEDRTLETVVKMLSTCIEQRDTLKRERDEARARIKELEDVDATVERIAPIILEATQRGYQRGLEESRKLGDLSVRAIDVAEAQGYERGVKEAAKEIEKIAAIFDHPSVYMGGPSNHAKRRAKEIATAILALLEKPKEKSNATD